MREYIKYLKNNESVRKLIVSEFKSMALFVSLLVLAFIFLFCSMYCEGWLQNLFVGLGTGAVTSALVSLAFYLNDKQIKFRERIKQRASFMREFKIIYKNIIDSINFDYCEDAILDLETYIKIQHRWFHNYYKRMIANNFTEVETNVRKECLIDFISINQPRFQQMFEYNSEWKNGEYTLWQKTELLNFYYEFKCVQLYINQNNYMGAFLEFSTFLERIKRMATEFPELKNFELLKFKYNEQGEIYIDEAAFEEKETDFKLAREFCEIRHNNYVNLYSKQVENEEQ